MTPGTATVTGEVVKEVTCSCGHRYRYRLQRTAVETYGGMTLTAQSADEKARGKAEAALEELLRTGVEACPCPQCGRLTPEMEAKLARDRSEHVPQSLQSALIGILVLAAAAWLGWRAWVNFNDDRPFGALSLAASALAVGAAGVFLGGGSLLVLVSGYKDSRVSPLPEDSDDGPAPGPEQALQRGLDLINSGKPVEGLTALEEAGRLGHPKAAGLAAGYRLSEKILELAHAGEPQLAAEALQEFSRLDPPPAPETVHQFRRLIESIPEGKMTQPDGAAGWNARGATLMDVGKLDEARACFVQALDLDADCESAWLNLALSFGRVRDFEPALTVLDRYLADHPASGRAWEFRGMTLANLERREEAVASYSRALEINPRSVSVLWYRSSALIQLGRNEEALTACRKGLEIAPADLDLLFNQGKALHRLGREAEALQCAHAMQRLDPEKARRLLEMDS